MQIVINKDFSVAQLVPSMVFQNSANASYLDIFAPFNVREYASVGVNIELPNGEYLSQTLAFPAPGQPYDYGLWTVPLSAQITALQGVVRFSLVFNGANETATTGIAELTVRRTAVPVLPSAPSSDVYQQILTQLSALQAYYGDADTAIEQLYNNINLVMHGENFQHNVMDITLLPGQLNGTSDLRSAHTPDAQQNLPGSQIYFDDTKYSLTVYFKDPDGTYDAIQTFTSSPGVVSSDEYPEVYYQLWNRTGEIDVADAQASLYRDNLYTNYLLTIAEAAATYRRIDDSYSKDEVNALIFDMPQNALAYASNVWDPFTRIATIYTLDKSRAVVIDLSDIYTKTETAALVNAKVNKTDFEEESTYVRSHAIGMLQYNSDTGVISYSTLDGNQSGSIDLPVESLVSSGYFDAETEELVLVLTNGSEIRIPASNLINPVWVTDVSQGGDQPPTATAVLNALNSLNAQLTAQINLKANANNVYTKQEVDDIEQELNSAILKNTGDISGLNSDVSGINSTAVGIPEESNDGYDLTFQTLDGATSKTFTNPAKYDKYDVETSQVEFPVTVTDSYGGYLENIVIEDRPVQYATPSPTSPAVIGHQEFSQLQIASYGKNIIDYTQAEKSDGSAPAFVTNGFTMKSGDNVIIPVSIPYIPDMNVITCSYHTISGLTYIDWRVNYTDGTTSATGLATGDSVSIPSGKTVESIQLTNTRASTAADVDITNIQLEFGELATTYTPYVTGGVTNINIGDATGIISLKDYDAIQPGGAEGYQLIRQTYTFDFPSTVTYYTYPNTNPTGIEFYITGTQAAGSGYCICTHDAGTSFNFSYDGSGTSVIWRNILTKLGITTTTEFTTWLESNDVTLIFKTAQPIQSIDLSAVTCNALKTLEVNKGYASFFWAGSTSIEPYSITADYRVDLKEYLNNVIETKTGHKYSVKWNGELAQLERFDDAAGITTDTANFGYFGASNPDYNNPFDDIYPWSGIKLCNIDLDAYTKLSPGESVTKCVTAWEGDPDFSYTDTNGVWRYRPEFWGCWSPGNYYTVSDQPGARLIHYPEEISGRWHGCEATRIINGDSTTCLLPLSNSIPATNIALSTLHTYAKNYGATLDSVYSIDADILLFIVEYATMNSQNAIGMGVTEMSRSSALYHLVEDVTDNDEVKVLKSDISNFGIQGAIFNIGTSGGDSDIAHTSIISTSDDPNNADNVIVKLARVVTATTSDCWSIAGLINISDSGVGSRSGYIGTNGKCNVYYRGKVLYGNFNFFVLGVYESGFIENPSIAQHIWIAHNDTQADRYDTLDTSVHMDTGLMLPSSSGYINALGRPPLSNLLTIPPFCTETGGDSSNPIGDRIENASLPFNSIVIGGSNYASINNGGLFCFNWMYPDYQQLDFAAARPRLKNPSTGSAYVNGTTLIF